MENREQRRFTVSELKEYDGRAGRPAYSAFKGKVYDVSDSPLWDQGEHTGGHPAGLDLTESMIDAPHGDEVFAGFPVVGELVPEEPAEQEPALRRFTVSELKECDGKEGRPAYSAYMGTVYDVSGSPLWDEGKHTGGHSAGLDLTEGMVNAPHGDEVFAGFPVVGELIPEEPGRQTLVQIVQGLHLHPILAHFCTAYSVLVPVLSILYVLTRKAPFETVSYYILVLGLLALPAGTLSGVFSWRVTYEGRVTKRFSRKIWYTVLSFLVLAVCFGWRTLDRSVLNLTTVLGYLYLALEVSLVPITAIIGHDGGKIVYG
jgi:predicted heme/steroid binding protein/uncharacterized membrane protein